VSLNVCELFVNDNVDPLYTIVLGIINIKCPYSFYPVSTVESCNGIFDLLSSKGFIEFLACNLATLCMDSIIDLLDEGRFRLHEIL